MDLSLYSIAAFIVMDTDGHRVFAKYYRPKHNPLLTPLPDTKQLVHLKEQKAFEKGLWDKTKRPGGDIIIYDSYLCLYKHSLDLVFYVIGPQSENELMLNAGLHAYMDALNMLLRNQVEKRSVLENLDVALLCLDETIDDGVIVETDSTAIASRVSRAPATTTDIVINEQTIMNAYQSVREKVSRFGQL